MAAVQMASGPNIHGNLNEAQKHLQAAADAGAELVVLPENFALMAMQDADQCQYAEKPGEGLIQDFLHTQARQLGLWIVAGTLPMQSEVSEKIRAACLIFDANGQQQGRFDKLHMFDVAMIDHDDEYHESATYEAGAPAHVVETPFGRLGVAICYDLRFPELFRLYQQQGVDFIALPSAFTAMTGKAHWHVLTRARAIENLCFLVAAAQGGYHVNGRETFGHSLIVDAWGNVLSEINNGNGMICAEFDHHHQNEMRSRFPVLSHRRIFCDAVPPKN